MTWIKGGKFDVIFSEPYYPMYHGMLKMDKEHVSHMMTETLKKAFEKSKFVVYPFDHDTINKQINKIKYMEKNLEKKMARFVELSMKFSVAEDLIEEIQDLKDLVPPPDYSGDTLTSTGLADSLWAGDRILPKQEEMKKEKPFFTQVEEGVTARWNVYQEYQEYRELQTTLNDYFTAADKL
ncbi:MAG: hypothetical protein KAH32_06390 [Chlamydiia bacterium]|nr:hypothetical protein [Chlamydiia bacterium]